MRLGALFLAAVLSIDWAIHALSHTALTPLEILPRLFLAVVVGVTGALACAD